MAASPRRLPSTGVLWATAVSIAALAASRWLDTPTVQYLVVWALATAISAILLRWLRGPRPGWAIACVALLVVGIVIGAQAQREIASVTANWSEWQAARARAGLDALEKTLRDAVGTLAATARDALHASADRETAFAQLQSAVK